MHVIKYGMDFTLDNTLNAQFELNQFLQQYEYLRTKLKQDNCAYYYMPVIVSEDNEHSYTILLSKDILLVRTFDEQMNMCHHCIFNDIKSTWSNTTSRLVNSIKAHKQQIVYPSALIKKWMTALAMYNQTEFVNHLGNKHNAYYNLFVQLQSSIVQSDIGQFTQTPIIQSPTPEQIRQAAFLRDTKNLINNRAALQRLFDDDVRNCTDQVLIARKHQLDHDIFTNIKNFIHTEQQLGTAEQYVHKSINECIKVLD